MNAGPPMMPPGYNPAYQIVQSPGYVTILIEMLHETRVIPTDGRPHAPANVRSWLGDSKGHWEGDTLVVETTNFNDKVAFRGASENVKVTERFTRISDDAIHYEFTVDDPSTWERAWKGEMPFVKIGGPIFEHACHEGNYGIPTRWLGLGRREESRRRSRQEGGGEVSSKRRDSMRRTLAVAITGIASGAGRGAPVGPSRVFRGIRREQAAHVEGHALEVGNDQPPLVVPHRREGPGRTGHRMDDRRRQPEHADPAGRDQVHREDWHGADDRGLSSEGSDEQSRRQKFRPARRDEALPESRQRGSGRRASTEAK